VILNNGTTLYIINDQSRFVNELQLNNDFVYAGTGLNLIKGIGMAVITIQTPLGPRKILLADAAYVPAFHINLAYLKKFNNKKVF